ncbi:energy-coupling factor transporter ATP-binding protein EcfA2 [Microbacterium testaceum]|uniref:ABC transporter ATP-binding protein n=1 Tax=Microbacterium testaceum TaxID=2033 RepID=UPI0027809E9C|nr:ATP-binding cassette domain-containing protein [Microbacterium testaceum]MDQ1114798.1 energy-coupling factor transporter ATP-binding protein EcfA2 [Microbacterium testaceum]
MTTRPHPVVASAAADTAALLSLRDVTITHLDAPRATPSAVSLDVRPGEVVLLLGPSGSGKSTLALAMNGLVPHAVPATVEGTVRVAGQDAATATVAELATTVGMVFQDPDAQLITGTLLDEVAFGPENLRLPVDEVLARAEAALRRMGLWHRRRESPDVLSGGGRQRLAIACALAMGSPLLVLDEPTANLDPAGVDDVYSALRDVVAAGDRAIVLVEHNLDAAVELVDRVVVLDETGCLVADGPVDAILRDRAADLHALGVWLPTATLAALRLEKSGHRFDRLPLTPAELRAALDDAPAGSAAPAAGSADAPQPQPRRGDVLVRVEGLRLSRGRTPVLHGVDLEVTTGEFVAVVGANGAGKTTLAQAIAGVLRPPRGTVRVDGLDVRRVDARTLSRHVGFVFQNPEHQFIATTVFDEIAHGLRAQRLDGRRLDDAEVRRRTDDLLVRFGLADKAGIHPFLLSGGQKRRLSVGTALVGGARLLVLDEPTFGQDRARADELLALLDDLREEGTTIIVVTHDMQVVAEHADRLIVVDGGRIVADGPTAHVFADDALLAHAGLRPPPLREAFAGLESHPELAAITRLRDLPGGAG